VRGFDELNGLSEGGLDQRQGRGLLIGRRRFGSTRRGDAELYGLCGNTDGFG
jgi:hypothetical protein